MNLIRDLVTHSESSQSTTNYPWNTQPPEIPLVPNAHFQPPSLDTQRHFSFDTIVKIFLFPTVQDRSQSSQRKRNTAEQQPAAFSIYTLCSEAPLQHLILKSKFHKMHDRAQLSYL